MQYYLLIILLKISSCYSQSGIYISATSNLYTFDYATCQATLIGNSLGPIWYDIAITPNGQLYGIDSENLYSISTTDGSAYYIANLFSLGFGINSLIALDNNHLMAISGIDLYKINVHDGSLTQLGVVGHGSSGDLTYYKGSYYLASQENKLIKITLTEDQSAIKKVTEIGSMDTEYNSVFGVLTIGDVDCEHDDLSIIAFEGYSVYKINPKTGKAQLVCDSVVNAGIWGATSLIETSFHPSELETSLPNVFTPNGDGINDAFIPIESIGAISWKLTILNRWGNVMCEHQNSGWDGNTHNGLPAHEGVYFYEITFVNNCHQEITHKGNVTVIR